MQPLVLIPILIAVPLLVIRAVLRKNKRAEAERWRAFQAEMAALGLPLHPSSTDVEWRVEGNVRSVAISIEPFYEESGRHRIRRTAMQASSPEGLARAGVFPVMRVPSDARGLRLLRFDPQFDDVYRAFGADPEQVERWLTPALREALLALGRDLELRIEHGTITLLLSAHVANARALARAADLLASIHLGEKVTPSVERYENLAAGFGTPWFGAAMLPPIIALVLGAVAPMIPAVPRLMSPIVCEQGTLTMVWTRSTKPGSFSGNLYCTAPEGDRSSHCALPLLLSFNAFYLPLAAAFAARAASRMRRQHAR